jgi:hypothetical protein
MKTISFLIIAIMYSNMNFAQTWNHVENDLNESVTKMTTYNNNLFAINSNTNIWNGTNWTIYNDTINIINIKIKNDTLLALTDKDIYFWNNNTWEFYFHNYMYDYFINNGYDENVVNDFFIYDNEIYLTYDMSMKLYKKEGDSIIFITENYSGGINDIAKYKYKMCLAGCFIELNGVTSPHFIQYNGFDFIPAENGFIYSCSVSSICEYNNLLYIGGYNLYEFDFLNNQVDSSCANLFTWNGSKINSISEFPNNTVNLLKNIDNKLFITGDFTEIGNQQMQYICSYNDTTFTNLGENFAPSYHLIKSIVEYNGDIYIAGNFKIINQNDTINNIAMLDLTNEINTNINSTNNINIFPNPFLNSTTFTFPENTNSDYSLSIYDNSGLLIHNATNIKSSKYKFNKKLKSGLYLYKIVNNKTGEISGGKLVVK